MLTATAMICSQAVQAQENLLANPSFDAFGESGPGGWNLLRGGPIEVRDDGGRDGGNYLRISDPDADSSTAVESDHLPARPGGRYQLTGWFRTTESCRPGLYLQFHNTFGERIAETHRQATGPTDGWVEVSLAAVAPDDVAEVSVLLYGYHGDTGSFDADAVSLTVAGGREPGSLPFPAAEAGGKSVVELGSRRELFVEEYLIDGLSGAIRRQMHHPQRQNAVLAPDQPWEGVTSAYLTVFPDGDKVRMYYRGSDEKSHQVTCYAESLDGGITFTRPNLGLFEFGGSKENNIVWDGEGDHNFSPFLDSNPACPADQKYKAVGGGKLYAFGSPDGIHWRKLAEEPVLTKGAFDSHNLAFWDPVAEEYVCYFRTFRDGIRAIDRATSPDFLHWSEAVTLDYGDAPPEHLYTNNILPYPRAPQIHLGLPARFVPQRQKVESHPNPGVSDAVVMASHDGVHFERWRDGFLLPGPDPKSWTDRTNYPAWGLIQSSPTEYSLYWTEHYRHPSFVFRRGTIRLDGFVSLHGDAGGGQMLTRPFTFTGARLLINYRTSAAGTARFELCDEAGLPLPGFELARCAPMFGDVIEEQVVWSDSPDLAALAGRAVRLRVNLQDADLYSLRFAR